MRYTYKDQAELRNIIDDIKLGKHKEYFIYNSQGRRLKYDFETKSASLMVVDDGIPQLNPFYKEVVETPAVGEVVIDATDDMISSDNKVGSTEDGTIQVDPSTEDNEYFEDDLPVNDGINFDIDESDRSAEINEQYEEVNQFDNSDLDKGEVLFAVEMVSIPKSEYDELIKSCDELKSSARELAEVVEDDKVLISELESKLDEKVVVELTTDELVSKLLDKGYKVTLSK